MFSPTLVLSQIDLAGTLACPELPEDLANQEDAIEACSRFEGRIKRELPLKLIVTEAEKTNPAAHASRKGDRTRWLQALKKELDVLQGKAQESHSHSGFIKECKVVFQQAFISLTFVKLSVCFLKFKKEGSLLYKDPKESEDAVSNGRLNFTDAYNDIFLALKDLFNSHYDLWAQHATLVPNIKDEIKAKFMKVILDTDPYSMNPNMKVFQQSLTGEGAVFGPETSGTMRGVRDVLERGYLANNQHFTKMVESARADMWLRSQWHNLKEIRAKVHTDAYPDLNVLKFEADGSIRRFRKQKRLRSQNEGEIEGSSNSKKPRTNEG